MRRGKAEQTACEDLAFTSSSTRTLKADKSTVPTNIALGVNAETLGRDRRAVLEGPYCSGPQRRFWKSRPIGKWLSVFPIFRS